MHARFDPGLMLSCDAEELDAIAELASKRDVERGNVPNAFDIYRIKSDRPAEGKRRQDRQLVRRVDSTHVKARIGLGIAELLRLGQHFGELSAALAHCGENVVAGSVQDAGDAGNAVARQSFAQRLDD